MIPFRNILVPLDGSELAEKAIAPARKIADAMARSDDRRPDGDPVKLILLRVVTPVAMLAADPFLYDEMLRMSVDEAQSYLNSVVAAQPVGEAILVTRTVNGSPAEGIVSYAEENDVDLIVMSSHGRTGSRRWVYGSVAEKVMHHAPCATAIIRAHVDVSMFQNGKMLVPLDGSELAEQVLEPVLALADAVDSSVTLLRVVTGPGPLPESLGPDGERRSAAVNEERAEAEAYLQRILAARDNPRLSAHVQNSISDVADAIITYADENQFDLIAMTSHGRSGLGRWIHGSVAEKVLRGADCATLIIRDRQP